MLQAAVFFFLVLFFVVLLPPGQGFQGVAGDRGPDGTQGPPVGFAHQTHFPQIKKKKKTHLQ